MATTYLITYDLEDEQYEPKLLKYVLREPAIKVTNSSYAVHWDKTAVTIKDELRALTNDKIVFAVIALTRPLSTFVEKEIREWLERYVA